MSTPYPTSDSPPRMPGSNDAGMSRSGGGTMGSTGSAGDTVSRVAQTAHETVDRLAEKAGPALERMRGRVSEMGDSMQARAERFGEMEEQWMESCRQTVREHPIASVAVAVVAGMVLSKMLSSR